MGDGGTVAQWGVLVAVQVAFDLFGGIAFLDGLTFVVLFFPFAQTDLQFGKAFFAASSSWHVPVHQVLGG